MSVPKESEEPVDLANPVYSGTKVLGPANHNPSPLLICFHGSGDSCASWQKLAEMLSNSHRVLLYDRGPENPKPKVAVTDMAKYLTSHKLNPPYVLIAHSYGGTFAREFLQRYLNDVVGMVLVETGQETALEPKMEEMQYRNQVLGSKPLSVIRGNTMIGKYAQLQSQSKREGWKIEDAAEFKMLETWDREDERLKKRQLDLSRNTHYVHIPDVGHGVISARPEVVAEEVRWVIFNQSTDEAQKISANKAQRILKVIKQVLK